MPTPELVAPAGNKASLFSAFQYGADSVYLGLKEFSARAQAENFGLEETKTLVNYAHKIKKQIYIAFNTLIKTAELDNTINILNELNAIKPDGIIIQDLGIYHILKKYFPDLSIHFSTQVTIHNIEGVKTAEDLGIKRVILARELTLSEIETIRKNTKIELEVFIHGARCYSYSGLCLFSSMIGGRSGNRGWCAQPCRMKYQAKEKEGYFFSMCDLMAVSEIEKLVNIGIDAFKIEGRLKSPLYVAFVTQLYRKILDHKKIDTFAPQNRAIYGADKRRRLSMTFIDTPAFKPEYNERVHLEESLAALKTIFSRKTKPIPQKITGELFTDDLFPGHLGLYIGSVTETKNHRFTFITNSELEKYDGLQIHSPHAGEPIGFSIRNMIVNNKKSYTAAKNQIVTIQAPVSIQKGTYIYLSSKRQLKDRFPILMPKLESQKIPTSLSVEIKSNIIILSAEGISKEYPVTTQKSKTNALSNEIAYKYFSRLGNSPYKLEKFSLKTEPDIFIPPKELNAVRRHFFAELSPPLHSPLKIKEPWVGGPIDLKEPQFTIKIDRLTHLEPCIPHADRIIIELSPLVIDSFSKMLNQIKGINKPIVFSIPPIKRNDQKHLIEKLLELNYTQFEISNLGAIQLLPKKGITISSDYQLYITNPASLNTLKELGITRGTFSPELSKKDLADILKISKNRADIILYSDLPYFYSSQCVWLSIHKKCPGKDKCGYSEISLKNNKGDEILASNNNCSSIIINKKPFSLSQHLQYFMDMGQKLFRIDFINKNYPQEVICDITLHVKSGRRIPGILDGNFIRKLF